MLDFRVDKSDLGFFSRDLSRPECVLCLESGDTFVSNWGGGVTRIASDGTPRHILPAPGSTPHAIGVNGFAITADGDFLLADLNPDGGGVWRLKADGTASPFLLEVNGDPIPPTNFVGVDAKGRVWITVSTRHEPRDLAYRGDVADGYVILIDQGGARIVAEGLGYTNEAIVDPSGNWLVVNETFGRRTSRFRIADDGSLGPRETVTEYGAGVYPDGLAFDVDGGIWMTSVVSNRLVHVGVDGEQTIVFEDCDAAALEAVENAFLRGELGRKHLDSVVSDVARSISSIAFGGRDRKTAYMGNLLDDKLYTFRSPVAGAAPSHWRVKA
jgi:sugar lactone lactonase YvrE